MWGELPLDGYGHGLPIHTHFIGSQQVLDLVTEGGVTHFPENLSNHSPIFIKLDVGSFNLNKESPTITPRTSWKKASEEERNSFKDNLAEKLRVLQGPQSVTCQDVQHIMMILKTIPWQFSKL